MTLRDFSIALILVALLTTFATCDRKPIEKRELGDFSYKDRNIEPCFAEEEVEPLFECITEIDDD